jgi:hypothetical protein
MKVKGLEILEDHKEAFNNFALSDLSILHKDLGIAKLYNANQSFDLIDPKVVFGSNEIFIYCSVLNNNNVCRVSLKVLI